MTLRDCCVKRGRFSCYLILFLPCKCGILINGGASVSESVPSGDLEWKPGEEWQGHIDIFGYLAKILRHTHSLHDAAWHVSSSHIVFTHTWYCLVCIQSFLECILIPLLTELHIFTVFAAQTPCSMPQKVCAAVQYVCGEYCREVPEWSSGKGEQIHLDCAGDTNMVILLPVQELACICFQSMHRI